jgi:hypothetical protein
MPTKIFIFIFLAISSGLFGQNTVPTSEEEGLDTKTLAYGLTTNNHSGLIGGAVLRHSYPVSKYKNKPVNRYISLELVNIKNSREKNIMSNIGSRYVYGKTNYLLSLRPQYGREYYAFTKEGENNSIGFSVIFAGGPSLGFQKPYYIKYDMGRDLGTVTVQYNPDIHTNPGAITGAASIFQNVFRGIKVIPGLHAKAAGNFDISTFNDNVTGIELGTMLEVFAKRPEILSSKFSQNSQVYASLYLTLYFGNKKLLPKKNKS